jgi:hypothetical protein
MVRQIKLEQIDDLMKDSVQKLVKKTTLQWTSLAKKATPRVTSNLVNSWQTEIKEYQGRIFTIVEYAEPVIYGTSLPPSWGGRFRTRQQTIKGFPELQAKQLTTGYIPQELSRIIRRT